VYAIVRAITGDIVHPLSTSHTYEWNTPAAHEPGTPVWLPLHEQERRYIVDDLEEGTGVDRDSLEMLGSRRETLEGQAVSLAFECFCRTGAR